MSEMSTQPNMGGAATGLIASALLLWGCGPSYQDLKVGAAEAPDVYAFTAEQCEGYRDEDDCRRFIGEICTGLQHETEQKVQGQLTAGQLDDAIQTLEGQSVAPCLPGRETYSVELGLLRGMSACRARRDDACMARRLDDHVPYLQRPIVAAVARQGRVKACAHFTEEAIAQFRRATPADLADSQGADEPAPRFSELTLGLDALRRAHRWCPDVQQPTEALAGAIGLLAASPARSVQTYDACTAHMGSVGWPAGGPVASTCNIAREYARRHLDAWVTEAVSAGDLEGHWLGAFNRGVTRLYQDMGIPEVGATLPTMPDGAPPKVAVIVQVRGRDHLGDYLFHTSRVVSEIRHQVGAWAEVFVDRAPTGARQFTFEVQAHVLAEMIVQRHEQRTEARSRYLAGTRDVPNPAHVEAERQCQRSTEEYDRCQSQYQREESRYRDCKRRQEQAESDYRRCQMSERGGCVSSTPYCSGEPRQCSPDRKWRDCRAVHDIPRTIEEEVWAERPYTIRHVEQRATLPAEIFTRGVSETHKRVQAVYRMQDNWIKPQPEYNIQGDPLELPTHSEMVAQVSVLLAGRIYDEIHMEHERLCAQLKGRRDRVAPRHAVAALMEAERYACGPQRPAVKAVVMEALAR